MSGTPKVPGVRKLTVAEREEFLALPHVAVVVVESGEERPPLAVPTWYAYEPGGTVGLITRSGKKKSRLIRAAGQLTLSVQVAEQPYRYVTVEGTVVRQGAATPGELARVLGRYVPAEALDEWVAWEAGGGNPAGSPEFVEVRPDRWLTRAFLPAG
ncbi:hypothetical protein [Actinokineospora enzanensis]|uniref:hypothetical protein n=1 Tax=Actinokineospora enzanensis TaxID=155975 RepID=UPI001B7F80EC|nr:hypothetical protein [Actinokineospora enzanensis]